MLFAPVAGYLREGLGAEIEPDFLDSVLPKGVLEISECAGAVDRIEEVPSDRL